MQKDTKVKILWIRGDIYLSCGYSFSGLEVWFNVQKAVEHQSFISQDNLFSVPEKEGQA